MLVMEEALIVLTLFRNSLLIFLLTMPVYANQAYIITNGDGNSLSIVQDGIDNYIDLTTNNFEDGFMEIDQIGNDNSVDLTISAGTGTGSSFDIYQGGNNNSYSAELWCNAEWCTLTVTQP